MNNICKDLLEIKAVFLRPNEPFTWASGIISPIYCDNRLILSYPEIRSKVEHAFADLVSNKYSDVDILMGTSTAGIPHAAYISEYLNLPMGYVRGKQKDHGRGNQIEGRYQKGDKVVVIEDLISTGKSSIEVVQCLKDAGLNVLGVVSIFSYGLEEAKKNFESIGVSVDSLATFSELVNVAANEGYIEKSDLDKVLAFQKDPHSYR